MSNSHFDGFEEIFTFEIWTGINIIALKHP